MITKLRHAPYVVVQIDPIPRSLGNGVRGCETLVEATCLRAAWIGAGVCRDADIYCLTYQKPLIDEIT